MGDESGARSKAAGRGMKKASILLIAAGFMAVTAFATVAAGLDRLALWPVVRACVADFKLTGAPFPCLKVDISDGEERGDVVLRPPLLHDLILAPTRKIVGIEDPFLQSPEAPNYLDAAWRARSFLKGADGQAPAARRGRPWSSTPPLSGPRISFISTSVASIRPSGARSLRPRRRSRSKNGRGSTLSFPIRRSGGRASGRTDLSDVEPFRLAAEALADKVKDLGIMMIMVAGVRVEGDDEFVILASYAGAPGAWWPVGADSLLDRKCPAGPRLAG